VIGKDAFYLCRELKSITFPNSLKTIDSRAFRGCYALETVKFGNSLLAIGKDAFNGCKLKAVVLPDSLRAIGADAFVGCINLSTVKLGKSVTSIGGWAFFGCKKLKEINIPSSVKTIGKNAFRGCKRLNSLTIPKSVKSIGKTAFPTHKAFKLKAYKGSFAHKYAKKNKVRHQLIAKVTFDANKGAAKTKSKVVTVGKKYSTLPKPERQGHAFKGWFTKKKGGSRIKSGTVVKADKAHVLYARWQKKPTPSDEA
jgi:uncharacterized repeat protein (TIGR02543 family)